LDASSAVCSDDDQVCVEVDGELDDLFCGCADAEVGVEVSEGDGFSELFGDLAHVRDAVFFDFFEGGFCGFAAVFCAAEVVVYVEDV